MKQHRVLGADKEDVAEYYEQMVVQVLRPKLVVSFACALNKTLVSLADGSVYEFPRGGSPRVVRFPERAKGRVLKVAAGEAHFVAITSNSVWNTYSWGASNPALLGRDVLSEESAREPQIIRDLPGKVTRVDCGTNFTLCCTATGELWAFGASECNFGLPPRQPGQLVVKLPWGSESRREENHIAFRASGRSGILFESTSETVVQEEPSPLDEGDLASTEDERDLIQSSVTPLPQSWFSPTSEDESVILQHALEARMRWQRAMSSLRGLRDDAHNARMQLTELRSSVQKQMAQNEADARSLIPFIKSGEIALPSRAGQETTELKTDSRISSSDDRQSSSFETIRRSGAILSDGLRINSKGHLSKIRTNLEEERAREKDDREKDAVVCARRLSEGVAVLEILQKDEATAVEHLQRAERLVRETEVALRDWRTQAVLLERAILRIKRLRRAKPGFNFRTGDCQVYPADYFRPVEHPVGVSPSENAIWLRARMDPDWGRRLRLIHIEVKLSAMQHTIIECVVLSSESLDRLQNHSGVAAPAKVEWLEDSLKIHLQHHVIMDMKQDGEDVYFFIGFVLARKLDESQLLSWMNNIKSVVIRSEGDAEVAARLMDEVEEKGAFGKPQKGSVSAVEHLGLSEWDHLTVEVLVRS